jgi:microcompartment protein CcmL/EutN
MEKALGLIEALGFTTAVAALDAASKAAEVTLVGTEKVIGLEKSVGYNILIAGEVAAVQAAVEAGVEAGNKVGRVASSKVIPRPHDELDHLLKMFADNLKIKEAIKEVVEDKDPTLEIAEKTEKVKKVTKK